MQRAEAALIGHIQRDVFVEQTFDPGQHHLFVAGGARFGARTQQQQQRADPPTGERVRVGTGQQQGVQQRQQAGGVARGETVQRRAMQGCQPLIVGGVHVGCGREQTRHDIRQAECARQHQHGHATGQAMFDLRAGLQQGSDDIGLAHAHRRRQRRGAAIGCALRVGTAAEQMRNHAQVAATGRTQQRGAALGIDGIHRQTEVDQASHRIGIASHRGRGHVRFAQRTAWQRPDPPVQPVGQIAPADRQRHAQRGLPVGSACFRRGALLDQQFQRGIAAQRGGQMQRGHAMAVARFAVHAVFQQPLLQAQPAQPHGQRQRRIASCRRRKRGGAAFKQFHCELLQPARCRIVLHAGAEQPGQATCTGRRHAVTQQHLQRWHRLHATREQRKHRHVAAGIAHFGIGAVAQQPVHRIGVERQMRVVQQATEFVRAAQSRQRVQAIALAELQAFAQQHQRRAIGQHRHAGGVAMRIADGSRQGIVGVEQLHDRPTPGFGGHVHGATAMHIDAVGRHLQIEQAADQRRRHAVGSAGQHHRVAAVAVDGQHIGLARDQAFEHRAARLTRGIQPRRAAEQIARFQIGAGRQQRFDDVAVASQRSFVQGAATLAVARIHARLVLEQQLHAGRVVFFGAGGGQQHRRAAVRFGMGAAFQQKFRQPPIADLARHRQR